MRFTLIDILIATLCFASGCFGASVIMRYIVHWLGYDFIQGHGGLLLLFGIMMGIVSFIIFSPPIYRWCRFLPLFLPRCPHCRREPRGYRITEARWPRQVFVCRWCQKPTEIWWRKPLMTDVSKTMPSLLLSWPESIGRWRPISKGEVSAAP